MSIDNSQIAPGNLQSFLHEPFYIGALKLPNRLIQGPLAGFSCAPFREMFYQFKPPAFCVTEMVSAHDVVHKHGPKSRYLYRSPVETHLAWQISGTDPQCMAQAALILANHGADLIDINCGCPKPKIRKKGAGSALLENPERLITIIQSVREKIAIPLTVKIRIQGNDQDYILASQIAQAGADALIVHGRRWIDDYDRECDWRQIANIKQSVSIPVIANGDIQDETSLKKAWKQTSCDAFMLSRAGTGRPWLYQELLEGKKKVLTLQEKEVLLQQHLDALIHLEGEHKAMLQSYKLRSYYLR